MKVSFGNCEYDALFESMGPHMPQKKKKDNSGSIHALFVLRVSMGVHTPIGNCFLRYPEKVWSWRELCPKKKLRMG